jgi:hypothetical protein
MFQDYEYIDGLWLKAGVASQYSIPAAGKNAFNSNSRA